MFDGMTRLQCAAKGAVFAGVTGGEGPAVLLLHGYPQTHLTWRHVVPLLRERHTLVVPDLPGYGDSLACDDGRRWDKRRVGEALVALMADLGHTRFSVVGHDRGARVGYRLALDHPDHVTAYASLAVVPTVDAFANIDADFALHAFHWFFLAQPHDLPERLLAADPDAFLDAALIGMAGSLDRFEPQVLAAYRAAFRKPSVRHAICEDYRAAAREDLRNDRQDRAAGRKLACPVLVLWPQETGPVPLAPWRAFAHEVRGCTLAGGHLLPEFAPQEVARALLPFLAAAKS